MNQTIVTSSTEVWKSEIQLLNLGWEENRECCLGAEKQNKSQEEKKKKAQEIKTERLQKHTGAIWYCFSVSVIRIWTYGLPHATLRFLFPVHLIRTGCSRKS